MCRQRLTDESVTTVRRTGCEPRRIKRALDIRKTADGTAGTIFVEVEPGVFGFAAGTLDGEPGRNVQLTGDIVGINFEPGTCHPGVDMNLGFPTSCVVFDFASDPAVSFSYHFVAAP